MAPVLWRGPTPPSSPLPSDLSCLQPEVEECALPCPSPRRKGDSRRSVAQVVRRARFCVFGALVVVVVLGERMGWGHSVELSNGDLHSLNGLLLFTATGPSPDTLTPLTRQLETSLARQPETPLPRQPETPLIRQPETPLPRQPESNTPLPSQPNISLPRQPADPPPVKIDKPLPRQPANPPPVQIDKPGLRQPANPPPVQIDKPLPRQPGNPPPVKIDRPPPRQPANPPPVNIDKPLPRQPANPPPVKIDNPRPRQPVDPTPVTKDTCRGAPKTGPGIPGSRLSTADQVRQFRDLMHCASTRGEWVINETPRPLPWRYGLDNQPYDVCDKWHVQTVPRGISNADADRVASSKNPDPATWHVRESLKYVWQVKPGTCKGLPNGMTLDPGAFKPEEFCRVLGRGIGTVNSASAAVSQNRTSDGREVNSNSRSEQYFRKVVLVGDSLQSQLALSLAALLQMGTVDVNSEESRKSGTLAPLTMPCDDTMIGNSTTVHYARPSASWKFCFGVQLCENVRGAPEGVEMQLLFMRSDHLWTHSRPHPDEGPPGNREIHMPWLDELVSPSPREREHGETPTPTHSLSQHREVESERASTSREESRERDAMEVIRMETPPVQDNPGGVQNGSRVVEESKMLSPVVVFNTGAHYWHTQKMYENLCDTLVETRRRCPHCLIIFRSTSAGHDACNTTNRPLSKALDFTGPFATRFHWGEIVEQTRGVRALVESVGGVYLDTESLTGLRGDGHVGWASALYKGAPDCLHYCTPGPMDFWSLLLGFALKELI